ncbi:uncharacterized protein [Alexandromys fortis]|uniref:uncharacterized protein isoform X2 n=1 Tax=Alexandromys fortis TaxID=100897 RepID=UPI00215336A1|nr:uncharacterized protein LOC126508735 isoform X2 [Microtus fortis]
MEEDIRPQPLDFTNLQAVSSHLSRLTILCSWVLPIRWASSYPRILHLSCDWYQGVNACTLATAFNLGSVYHGPDLTELFLFLQIFYSSQSQGGATTSFAYFPNEKFLSENFHEVDLGKEKPQPGDLFLFELLTPKAQYFGAHVGVYCGHDEIIHFMAKSLMETFVEDCEGVVYKEGLHQLKRSRKLLRVLRKRGGVDIKLLERRVYEAMNRDPPHYNIKNNNCVHFALKLLGMYSVSSSVLVVHPHASPWVLLSEFPPFPTSPQILILGF